MSVITLLQWKINFFLSSFDDLEEKKEKKNYKKINSGVIIKKDSIYVAKKKRIYINWSFNVIETGH